MSEEQSSKAPLRRTPQEIAELLDDFENSGLSRVAFSQARGISKNSLDLYRKRRRQAQQKAGSSDRLIQVEVTPEKAAAASALTVVLPGGRRIEVKRGFDAGVLSQLVRLLEQV